MDRNGSDNLIGKIQKYEGIKEKRYCKADSKFDRFD